MLPPLRLRCLTALLCLAAFTPASRAASATQEWKDAKGATFRGEPVEAMGPFLLFRTGGMSSKFIPMRVFSPEDCVRFHQAIADRAPHAERWADAKGQATSELIGRVGRIEDGKFKALDLTRLAEPELLIVLYAARNVEGGVYPLFDNISPFISRVQRVYPGRVATVVLGSNRNPIEPKSLPAGRGWYVVETARQAQMKLLSRFAPDGGFVMMVMTREGVPLYGAPANNVAEVTQFVDGASDILWQLNSANPRSIRDRAHYLAATRPLLHATSKAAPFLLAEPLRVEGLRDREVKRIEARLAVSPTGAVSQVELLSSSEIPDALRPAITEALRRNSLFVPAVENGQTVAANHAFLLTVGPVDKQLAADAAWVNGEARIDVPIKSWLVLKHVKVPEQMFSGIDRVSADGTVMMKAVTAGKSTDVSTSSQMTAFNSDWFTETGGPGSIRPVMGAKQDVDGEMLTWKKLTPYHGLIDMLEGASYGKLDYCIGYAWTEVEMPQDVDAWLGIGSDDGLKVWVNGELVNDKWTRRTSRLDDDVVPIRLKKGANHFLIKIQNAKGNWSFTTRLRVRG